MTSDGIIKSTHQNLHLIRLLYIRWHDPERTGLFRSISDGWKGSECFPLIFNGGRQIDLTPCHGVTRSPGLELEMYLQISGKIPLS